METAHFLNDLIRGPQVQVVSVGKLYLAADIFQVFRAERAFNGTLGADVHEHGGLNRTMGTGEFTPPGLSLSFL